MTRYLINLKIFNLFLLVFLSSLFIRLICNNLFDFSFKDANEYKRIADVLAISFNFDSFLAMPLYPVSLAFSRFVFKNFYVIDFFISSAFPIIIYLLSYEIFQNKKAAIISSIISIFYPMNIFYAISGLTENLYVFFLFISFLFFYRRNYFFGIIFMILTIYTRPIIIYAVPFLVISFFYANNENIKFSIKKFFFLLLIFILLFAPWWIMNFKKYENFVLTNLGGGIALYIGNNEKNITGGNDMGVDADFSNYNISDKYLRDKLLKRDALIFIKNNPDKFIKLSIKRFLRFWNFFPNHEDFKNKTFFKFVIFSSYLPILILSLFYLFINLNFNFLRQSLPLLLFIAYTTIIHIISIASLRYRYPIEPILIILCGQYISLVFAKFSKN